MISFPNAKINLGLYITGKRDDGYHDILTVMVPCGPTDILEFVESGKDCFTTSGIETGSDGADNLVIRALHLLRREHIIPPLNVHLHKAIPVGAGLGGGSSDGAFMLKMLRDTFLIDMENADLKRYASLLGSDCSFFIDDIPALASGRGEILETFSPFSGRVYLILVNPGFPVSTKDAYAGVVPAMPEENIRQILSLPPDRWRGRLINQFEDTVFKHFPQIGAIRDKMYASGAMYASMSGSGSSVYGLFPEETETRDIPRDMVIYQGWMV